MSVVVAENSDGHQSVDLREAMVDLTIRFESNLGYAAAVNEAIRQQASASQVILVLTSDVAILRGSFTSLVAGFSDPTIGIVGPALQTNTETWLGGTWSPIWGWARHQVTNALADEADTEPVPTTWADGSCLAIDRSTYQLIGGFDERTFLYGEDLLFCLKTHQLGKRVVIATDVVVHQESGMTKRSGAHGYLLVRNEVLAARELSSKFGLRVIITGLVRSVLELKRATAHGSRQHHLRQSLGMLWGVFDASRWRYGPPPKRLARMAKIPAINRH